MIALSLYCVIVLMQETWLVCDSDNTVALISVKIYVDGGIS